METKHTKGKWISRNETIWNQDMSASIAIVHSYGEISEEEARANAKLIAATPELLEVANSIILENDLRKEAGFQPLTDTIVEIAKEAIKKATD